MQVGGFLFYRLLLVGTTSRDRKNKMKSEKAFSESTPIHALLKYGLDGGSQNFESAVNAYVAWAKTRSVQSRLLLLQALTETLEKHEGNGFPALLPFISDDPDPGVVSKAALNMALLFFPDGKDPLHGPELVASLCLGPEEAGEREGAILAGLMLIGDERVTPIIKDVWVQLPPPARIAALKCELKQVFRAQVLLLLDLLERETDEKVYGSLAVALGNCAEQATKFGILDIERVLPVWKAPDEPILIRRHLTRLEFYSEFEGHLDHLIDTEPGDPKVMPLPRLLWSRHLP
jgi:hypothetical protein